MKNITRYFLIFCLFSLTAQAQTESKTLNCQLTVRAGDGLADNPVMKTVGSDAKVLDLSQPYIKLGGGDKMTGWFSVVITPSSTFGSFATIVVKDLVHNRISSSTLTGLDLNNPKFSLSADLSQGNQGAEGEVVLTCVLK